MDGDIKSQQLFIGVQQCTVAVAAGKAAKAYIARDTDAPVREPFENLCRENLVPITYFDTKQQLGRACGIDVGAACAVVLI